MVAQRTTLTNAYESTLSAELDGTALSMTVADATGLDDSYDFYLVIDPESATKREYVECEDVTGSVITIATGRRYLAGSAQGSGITHDSGAVVRMVPLAQHIEDLNDRIDAVGDHGDLAGLTDDDHTQYPLKTVWDAKGSIAAASAPDTPANLPVGTNGQVLAAASGESTGLEWTDASPSDHGGLTGKDDDDHTQYHNDARAATWHDGESGDHVTNGNTHNHDGGDGGEIDHGALGGKSDDDHSQYLTVGRHDSDDHSNLESFVVFSAPGAVLAQLYNQRLYLPFDADLIRVDTMLGTASSSGSVEVDINRNGSTIFSTQSNRPIITSGNYRDQSGTPNTTGITQGTHYLQVQVDADGTGAEDLVVIIIFERS